MDKRFYNFIEVLYIKQTILIVEDDKMIRNLVKIFLEKDGYDVIEVTNGEEAKKLHPCLIILDLMLPKLSGEEFVNG